MFNDIARINDFPYFVIPFVASVMERFVIISSRL